MSQEEKALVYQLLSREEKLKLGVEQEAVVDHVDAFLLDSINHNASDIHIHPENDVVSIRYRIDGVLYDKEKLAHERAHLIISRLKVLAHLDIAQHRIPQDGKIKVFLMNDLGKKSTVDLRISTFPTTCGEKMVIRILDSKVSVLSLDELGLSEHMKELLGSLVAKKQGLILVTGPTGSGKTTTLYALLSMLNDGEKNIITIEDPVEYEMTGITQSQVNEKAGFSFENGLKSILRQDPDIILVGEVRDKPTVQIAIQSALTGHLVLSTLHTNDAPSAVMRLLEMEIEPFLISATLSGVLAQRLVRRLCEYCKHEEPVSHDVRMRLADFSFSLEKAYVPVGCTKCHSRGYNGRIGVFQLLVIDQGVGQLISQKADVDAIKREVARLGLSSLLQDGLEKVERGLTSLDEVFSHITFM